MSIAHRSIARLPLEIFEDLAKCSINEEQWTSVELRDKIASRLKAHQTKRKYDTVHLKITTVGPLLRVSLRSLLRTLDPLLTYGKPLAGLFSLSYADMLILIVSSVVLNGKFSSRVSGVSSTSIRTLRSFTCVFAFFAPVIAGCPKRVLLAGSLGCRLTHALSSHGAGATGPENGWWVSRGLYHGAFGAIFFGEDSIRHAVGCVGSCLSTGCNFH